MRSTATLRDKYARPGAPRLACLTLSLALLQATVVAASGPVETVTKTEGRARSMTQEELQSLVERGDVQVVVLYRDDLGSGDPRDIGSGDHGELFSELAKLEDPTLANHRAAGDLTGTELVITIIFLILLFPIGIILLIVFLVDDD